jgi:hypothetical protein
MWDDVIIGRGERLNGACLIRRIGEADISGNDNSYWIHQAYLGGGMTIFRNTPEGKTLRSMLAEPEVIGDFTPDAEITDWLENLFLDHVENDRLKMLVRSAMMRAASAARKKKAKDIRKAFRRVFEKIDEY